MRVRLIQAQLEIDQEARDIGSWHTLSRDPKRKAMKILKDLLRGEIYE